MRILQINQSDLVGGAAVIAWNLHRSFVDRGLASYIAVGRKFSDDAAVMRFSDYSSLFSRVIQGLAGHLKRANSTIRGCGRIGTMLSQLVNPMAKWEHFLGYEGFSQPDSWAVLKRFLNHIDIVHCHNLHIGYFDLRVLPWLTRHIPVVVTLHDAWLLTGHCAHPLDCEKWKTGCGKCPDITRSRAIRRDASSFNWHRKRRILAQSPLYVATPSHWLMDKVRGSILAAGAKGLRVIPNGVDRTIFRPSDRNQARQRLGIPSHANVLLFVAYGIQSNRWKDFATLQRAFEAASRTLNDRDVLFIGLGGEAKTEQLGPAKVTFVPYVQDRETVAQYYHASDLYIHASLADTFPNAVIEALSCAIPTIATAVDGIPEQIRGLHDERFSSFLGCDNRWAADQATGVLVPKQNSEAMATAIRVLLGDGNLRRQLGDNAARHAAEAFDLERQAEVYLEWYKEIIEQRNAVLSRGRPAEPIESGKSTHK